MCLAQGHNAVIPVRLEPGALRSQVKQSTTEPLHSLIPICHQLASPMVQKGNPVDRFFCPLLTGVTALCP